jgi:opacity protein-like surface antigen
MRALLFAAAVALLCTGAARAADNADADADALTLADHADATPQQAKDWRLSIETAASRTWMRGAASPFEGERLSLDASYDARMATGLRAVLSDRLDLMRANGGPGTGNVNTLREAYLSWQPDTRAIVDIGRINLRYGAASGYNPTDYFKEDAVRAIVSPAPQSLRENRQGTAGVQGQWLSATDSVSLMLSPKLASSPDARAASLDWGATNPRNRWLLAASHKFSETFSPQLLLFGGAGTPTQAGLNVSSLVSDNTTVFGEVSVGRGASLAARAADIVDAPRPWQRRASFGFTTTTAFNLSITNEFEFNSSAPGAGQWDALGLQSPRSRLRLLSTAQDLQDLPVRRALFTYLSWQDVFIQHLDVTGFVRFDLETHSRAQWLEARYHWDRADVALQWQLYSGPTGSVYASVPQRRNVQAVVRVFF